MPPATTSLAPVTAALDLKESGVTKVIHRGSPQAGALERAPGRQDLGRFQWEQLDFIRTVCDFPLFAFGRRAKGCVAEREAQGVGASQSRLPRAQPWQVSCEPNKGTHKLVLWKGQRAVEDRPNSGSAITC